MLNSKKLAIFLLIIILSLGLREVPYINIFVVRQLWLVYSLLLFFLFFPLLPAHLFKLIILLLMTALLFALLKLDYLAEMEGVAIYFLLWLIVGLRIKEFFQKTRG